MTNVLCAYEGKQPGSAAEKLAQRSDLEAMINQLEEESHARAREALPEARQRLRGALTVVKKRIALDESKSSTKSEELVAMAEAELVQEIAGVSSVEDRAQERHPESLTDTEHLGRLQQSVCEHVRLCRCVEQGGEIPVHFITLTTAIYHWKDLDISCVSTSSARLH